MSKTLRVIDPFFIVDVNDTFTLSEDGKFYVFQKNEEFRKAGESDDIHSTYNSTFNISIDYAKQLIADGYLEEVGENKSKSFVNVFDEIDNLIVRYNKDLANINLDMAGQPECVKVEKTTVLTNILSVLNHLRTLRK
jgi:hypothetical protein